MAQPAENATGRGLRRWCLALTALLPAIVAALWTAHGAPTYRTSCVIDYGREPIPTNGVGARAELGASSEEWYRTQDFLLASNSVAQRAVQQLKLHEDRAFLGLNPRDRRRVSVPDAAQALQQRLVIVSLEGTHLARIEIEDRNPQRAAQLANAIAEAYLKKALEDRAASTERALTWLREQIIATSRRLEETTSEFSAYLERHNDANLSLNAREEMLTEEIKRVNQSLVDTRLRRLEVAARVAKLKAAQSDPPFVARTAEIDQDEQVKQIRTAYFALALEQRQLEATEGSKEAIELTRRKLDVVWDQMKSAIDGIVRSAQAELTAAQQLESQLQAALERANTTGREIQREKLEYGRLERERNEAEQFLNALRERSTEAALASATGAFHGKIVEPATPPAEPVHPPVLRNAAFGALAGVLLATVLVLLASRMGMLALGLDARSARDVG